MDSLDVGAEIRVFRLLGHLILEADQLSIDFIFSSPLLGTEESEYIQYGGT